MDQKFKKYLEDKGLEEVQIFSIAVPVLFGVLRKLKLILVDCYYFCNCRFCYCLLQWNLSPWSLHIIRKPLYYEYHFWSQILISNHLIRKLLWSLPVSIMTTILIPNNFTSTVSTARFHCHLFSISCISFYGASFLCHLVCP